MPDWSSQAEIAKDSDIFVKLIHVLSGLYLWDIILSLDFDWDFITRRKPFRWPMIFYFADRYLLLFALVGILVSLNSTVPLNCQALYTFNQLAGNAAVGLASINLSLRTIAVYGNSKPLVIILVIVILGHWSLILQGVNLKAVWSEEARQCVIVETNTKVLAATFIYSMCFDLLVFLLNLWKLYLRRERAGGSMGTSRLGKMIFGDGLIYFFIAFLSNVVATVFMLLNLNPIMSIIFNVPSAIAGTIVACAAVRRLSSFKNSGAEVYGTSAHSMQLRGTGPHSRPVIQPHNPNMSGGVHVQMETFTRAEEDIVGSPSTPSHIDFEDEARKKEFSVTDYDIEAKAAAL
ncbi:hypothetical protein K435DRAFT_853238 [Dendrothele bispora CBS 962.96]|uniref:Transmembrane protein n=1 Tax=Dendrothele bispora (strain CBS 962.96) TaxID=1314807 RepID=A0A4S8MIE5_DENBC|nr:hypothetical protein K435DRAFT_853238 [Dendrothele bispora CBS 962.96]